MSLLLALLRGVCIAQPITSALPNSTHGWHLSPHGTIRVLVLFAEVDWDVDPTKDPAPKDLPHWPVGQLPTWKDDLFDAYPQQPPRAQVSRYYNDISMGHYQVLGDHVDRLITIKQSSYPAVTNAHGIGSLVAQEASRTGTFVTRHGLAIADFDQWRDGGQPGMPKERVPDEPHRFDHVMVIVRNCGLTHGQGSTDPGSIGKLFGFESDTQSRFGGMNGLPFEILKHEFNHLLLGGNNFHSGGGNAAQFNSFFLPLQGGHSMMGASGSALMTAAGWDRDRLGWRPPGAAHRLNAQDGKGAPVNGDLDPLAGDTGVFLLRDFVSTGDVIRIRLPFIPEDRYQQWLWLENHQGATFNGSPTDVFHYQYRPCSDGLQPGMTATVQVDRELRSGPELFSGYADYLRPLPANGLYDLSLLEDTVSDCPYPGQRSITYALDPHRANPFTGNHELELPLVDRNEDGSLARGEHMVPNSRLENGVVQQRAAFYGRPEHLFQVGGKRTLGMSTNPALVPQLTLVSNASRALHKGAPDVRATYLNGLRVELLDGAPMGMLKVRVRADDTVLEHDVRWCSDSIVLPPLRGRDGRSLTVLEGATLLLDRSLTPTRYGPPVRAHGATYHAPPTRFTLQSGAHLYTSAGARLELRRGSEVHVLPGAHLHMADDAQLTMDNDCRIVLHGDGRLTAQRKVQRRIARRGLLVRQ